MGALAKLKAWAVSLWAHRTKTLGSIAIAAGVIENQQAQLGAIIPRRYQGAGVIIFGLLALALGIYNRFAKGIPSP